MNNSLFSIVLLLVLAYFSPSLCGQSNISLRAGMNLAKVVQNLPDNGNVQSVGETKFTTGWHIGAAFKVPINSRFVIQPELLYSIKGSRSVDPVGGTGTLSLSYISVPILFGFQATESLRLLFGPEVDYLLGANQNYGTTSQDVTNFYEDFAVGLTGGASYEFFNGINVGLRGHCGASSIIGKIPFTSEDGTYLGDLTASNLYFAFTFGYSL